MVFLSLEGSLGFLGETRLYGGTIFNTMPSSLLYYFFFFVTDNPNTPPLPEYEGVG